MIMINIQPVEKINRLDKDPEKKDRRIKVDNHDNGEFDRIFKGELEKLG